MKIEFYFHRIDIDFGRLVLAIHAASNDKEAQDLALEEFPNVMKAIESKKYKWAVFQFNIYLNLPTNHLIARISMQSVHMSDLCNRPSRQEVARIVNKMAENS